MHPRFIIISGGQSGVDTAAIKSAIAHRIPYQGFVPRGFINEYGRISQDYISSAFGFLQETDSPESAKRTRLNCEGADGILTIASGGEEDIKTVSKGTELGVGIGRQGHKELWFVDLREYRKDKNGEVDKVVNWLQETNVERCAIGGPRESEEPGVEMESEDLLNRVWQKARMKE
jgi:hypothetical protein